MPFFPRDLPKWEFHALYTWYLIDKLLEETDLDELYGPRDKPI